MLIYIYSHSQHTGLFKMNTIKILVMVALLQLSSSALALDNMELIEARQSLMKLYGINMDVLYEMLNRIEPYNNHKAKVAAENLLALSKLNASALWPAGTDVSSENFGSKTYAKPEIWMQKADISKKQENLVAALEVLARDAGWSLRSLEDTFDAVDRACKGCHKSFRAKK